MDVAVRGGGEGCGRTRRVALVERALDEGQLLGVDAGKDLQKAESWTLAEFTGATDPLDLPVTYQAEVGAVPVGAH